MVTCVGVSPVSWLTGSTAVARGADRRRSRLSLSNSRHCAFHAGVGEGVSASPASDAVLRWTHGHQGRCWFRGWNTGCWINTQTRHTKTKNAGKPALSKMPFQTVFNTFQTHNQYTWMVSVCGVITSITASWQKSLLFEQQVALGIYGMDAWNF